jgi:hypothetical protein
MRLRQKPEMHQELNRAAFQFMAAHHQCSVSEIDEADIVLVCSDKIRFREIAGILSGALLKAASIDPSHMEELAAKIQSMKKPPLVVHIDTQMHGFGPVYKTCDKLCWPLIRISSSTEVHAIATVIVGLTVVNTPYVCMG